MSTDLPWGWTPENVQHMAWRVARGHPTSVFSARERADVAYYAIVILLYESDTEPTRHQAFNAGMNQLTETVRRELKHHGYSTKTSRPLAPFAACWTGTRQPHDEMEEGIIERIAVHQVLRALPWYERRAIEALAEHGHYAPAADSLGVTYNSIRVYLRDGRRKAIALWVAPDPPPRRRWGRDSGNSGSARPIRSVMADRRKRARNRRAA